MNKILEILSENLFNKNVFFVFPSEVASSLWLDKLITENAKNTNSAIAVAKERFKSWDTFKGESIKSKMTGKTSVPSIVRKIFAENIIEENKELIKNGEEPLFLEIINPKYADLSSSFADWISSLLPQLKTWKNLHDGQNQNAAIAATANLHDGQNQNAAITTTEKDYLTIYKKYSDFLDAYNFFEPAWENPPFNNDGKKFIIFFPECLQDFSDYQELLLSSNDIELKTINDLFDSSSVQKATLFDNSPEELHTIALYLKNCAENLKIPYSEIAISLTDTENYLPYIEKELKKYEIPYTTRIGKSLSSYDAGKLFLQIQECYTENFSFEKIRNLLTNQALPFENPVLANDLIQFGIKNNCVCSYVDDGKLCYPFEDAFKNEKHDMLLENFYLSLKTAITKIVTATSFSEIIRFYWEFREKFFYELDEDEKIEERKTTDLILGRAISELSNLQEIQKDFPNIVVKNPFAFFVKIVDSKEYLQQSKKLGVSIYPYRLAAAAPYSIHIVPNATQKTTTVKYAKLHFLPQNLKEKLDLSEIDVSETFIKMYQFSSAKNTIFSVATNSYSGYSIPHSLLQVENELNKGDFADLDIVANEKNFVKECSVNFEKIKRNKIEEITTLQNTGMELWSNNAKVTSFSDKEPGSTMRRIFLNMVDSGLFRISATLLKQFATCKKKVVFQNLLKLYEEQTESEIDDDKKLGTFYHKVLETYFKHHKDKRITISAFESDSENLVLLQKCIKEVYKNFKLNPINKMLFYARLAGIEETLTKFLCVFTQEFEGYSVLFVEKEINTKDIPTEIANKNHYYVGVIDLVLALDGKACIVDYKTTSSPKLKDSFPNDNFEMLDFQMAMYIYLYIAKFPREEVGRMSFASITKASIQDFFNSEKGKKSVNDVAQAFSCMETYAQKLAAFLLTGNLDLSVDVEFEDCLDCRYSSICRSNYNVSGIEK